MSDPSFEQLQISTEKAESIANELYGIRGTASPLPGELDMNFLLRTTDSKYILKVSRPDIDDEYIDFQQSILQHIGSVSMEINAPHIYADLKNRKLSSIIDENGIERKVRLYSWIEGRLWSSVNPISNDLLYSLGREAGKLTKALQGFDHPYSHRSFEWDISQAEWTLDHIHLFTGEEREIISHYHESYKEIEGLLFEQRKAIVHNDVNDNNIIVSEDLLNPKLNAIIDFGDAIHTAVINDLAITLAYAIMGKPDPMHAAHFIIKGYHEQFPLKQEELELLYTLVAIRLIISITKSGINKIKEPENEYLLISEKPAWALLKKWSQIDENFAHFYFRSACGLHAHPSYEKFTEWITVNKADLSDLFQGTPFNGTSIVDMSISSTWLGHRSNYENIASFSTQLRKLQEQIPDKILTGGYLEIRPFYSTEQYVCEGNSGPEYRSIHLGTDFWLNEGTAIYAPYDGIVYSIHNNDYARDYGPTLLLEHIFDNNKKFYTLYGHLGMPTFDIVKSGQSVKKGELLGIIGGHHENGGWAPHLHFQIMLDLLGNTNNFQGVALPSEKDIWACICPDPELIFGQGISSDQELYGDDILGFREEHLGKSLSLSYDKPLEIQRGEGAYLMEKTGRRYLDTVNNVAHVGHEHSRVVQAGQRQMAVLNTNTRYLHRNINNFAGNLLNKFPPELSVVHLVNSGSEANELALRMVKTFTGQNDIIAVEAGYHGNTGACIDISSYKFDGKGGPGAPPNTHIVPLPDTYRGIYTGKNKGEKYARHIHEKINMLKSEGRKIAAFICESIISCGGQVELPEGYLKNAYDIVREAGGLCIADEVQVGCGRVGTSFWGFELHGVIPDIVTIGKPIGNGHPLAAVVCTREVAEAFANGMEYFNTFGGNPVSCAIGNEVLNVIRDEHLQENARRVGKYLLNKLTDLQKSFPIIGDVRGKGLFLGFELNKKNKNPLGEHATYLSNRMKDLGILMSTDGPHHNVLKIKPPMVFSISNADELILRLSHILKEDFMQDYDN